MWKLNIFHTKSILAIKNAKQNIYTFFVKQRIYHTYFSYLINLFTNHNVETNYAHPHTQTKIYYNVMQVHTYWYTCHDTTKIFTKLYSHISITSLLICNHKLYTQYVQKVHTTLTYLDMNFFLNNKD